MLKHLASVCLVFAALAVSTGCRSSCYYRGFNLTNCDPANCCDMGCAGQCGMDCGVGCGLGCGPACAAYCAPACDPCGDVCDAGCVDPCAGYYRYGPLSWLFDLLAVGYCCEDCGERYWGDWSDPPDCCDPCDRCGNWTGSSSRYRSFAGACGHGAGCDCGYGYDGSAEWVEGMPISASQPRIIAQTDRVVQAAPTARVPRQAARPTPAALK